MIIMGEPKKPYTLKISKLYLEKWGGWYFQKYLNEIQQTIDKIYVSKDDGNVDKVLKIDLINTDNDDLTQEDIDNRKEKGLITGNVKTHEFRYLNSFSFHRLELDNNDCLIFYEKAFDENQIIKEKYIENENKLVNYLWESNVYVISTNDIKELMKDPKNNINDRGSNGEFYAIPLSCVKEHSHVYKFGEK